MSEPQLTPEEVLLLAQAALTPGAPVKVRSYVKHSTTGKQVVVRQAIRGATGGAGRTPINPPVAQTTPVISNKAIQSEAAAARAGVAQQKAAASKAAAQAAAALKAQKQQQAAQKKQAAQNKKNAAANKKTAAPKTAAPKTTAPKAPKLGGLAALRAPRGSRLPRGRSGRLFPGSRLLGNAMSRSRRASGAKNKSASRRDGDNDGRIGARTEGIARQLAAHKPAVSSSHLQKKLYETSARKVDSATRSKIESQYGSHTQAAHRALEIAAAYRKSKGHGAHGVGAGFHDKLAGEVIKHEAKRLNAHLHLSQAFNEDISLAQQALRIEGFAVEVTGQMNDETANALAQFLSRHGVDIDADD